jgi:hypothetical protein
MDLEPDPKMLGCRAIEIIKFLGLQLLYDVFENSEILYKQLT